MKKSLLLFFFFISCFANNLQKPMTYDKQNIKGWYMSEKLDGIRAYWDGKQLLTKNGNKINTKKEFTKNFPSFELDGELWTKRGDFENIQSIVLDDIASNKWSEITYNIFEVPNAKGDFQTRLNKAKNWFKNKPNKYIKFVPQIKCKDKKHLQEFLEKLVSKNAEGVIIKNPHKHYFQGRSQYILKVKKFFDMEGKIIDINYDKKDKNRMKSLVIKLPNNIVFNLGGGFTNKQRYNPPKIGEIVTFKYYGFTKYNKPKFASFLRVRKKE
jgi:DNA ligase-1